MGYPAINERALVLRITSSGESFNKIDILTPESGSILCLKRISKKNPLGSIPDLFDTADVHLESSGQETVRFVKEYQMIQRRGQIGKSYHALCHASEICSLIAHNGPYLANTVNLYRITERALNAFAEQKTPSIVLLKALYMLLKEEGYPIREAWWPQLSEPIRKSASQLINTPAPESASAELVRICTDINQNLLNWLSCETDLVLPTKQQGK